LNLHNFYIFNPKENTIRFNPHKRNITGIFQLSFQNAKMHLLEKILREVKHQAQKKRFCFNLADQ